MKYLFVSYLLLSALTVQGSEYTSTTFNTYASSSRWSENCSGPYYFNLPFLQIGYHFQSGDSADCNHYFTERLVNAYSLSNASLSLNIIDISTKTDGITLKAKAQISDSELKSLTARSQNNLDINLVLRLKSCDGEEIGQENIFANDLDSVFENYNVLEMQPYVSCEADIVSAQTSTKLKALNFFKDRRHSPWVSSRKLNNTVVFHGDDTTTIVRGRNIRLTRTQVLDVQLRETVLSAQSDLIQIMQEYQDYLALSANKTQLERNEILKVFWQQKSSHESFFEDSRNRKDIFRESRDTISRHFRHLTVMDKVNLSRIIYLYRRNIREYEALVSSPVEDIFDGSIFSRNHNNQTGTQGAITY